MRKTKAADVSIHAVLPESIVTFLSCSFPPPRILTAREAGRYHFI
ncbi:hypothetical protein [Bifidobacterium bifidum]|jgi:hypothetical protein